MRNFLIPVLILTLSASGALAATPPLDPGKPAGVRQAELEGGTGMLVVAGAALIGIAIALGVAGNGPASPNTNPATSTSSTTP